MPSWQSEEHCKKSIRVYYCHYCKYPMRHRDKDLGKSPPKCPHDWQPGTTQEKIRLSHESISTFMKKNSKRNTRFYSWTTPHITHLKIYFPKLQPDCIINQVMGVNLEHQPGGWRRVLLRHWPACHWMAKCRLLVVVTETKNAQKNVTSKQWFPLSLLGLIKCPQFSDICHITHDFS